MARLTFESWRRAARPLLNATSPSLNIDWLELAHSAPVATEIATDIRLPRELMRLLKNIACYRDAGRWDLMYRLVRRIRSENPWLLEDGADPDVANAVRMDRAIHRDVHKMHAFVRFREICDSQGEVSYFAWFEPQHEILRPASEFFAKRFSNMRWTIATPDGAALWDGHALRFEESPQTHPAVSDSSDELWRTYYRSICNEARINPKAMQREMPQHYWRNLPEASEIGTLVRHGAERLAARSTPSANLGSARDEAARRLIELPVLSTESLQGCRRCPLWSRATQAVEGRGPDDAAIMLVGEQPGDQEDLAGEPFIGPAGNILSEALIQAGIKRDKVFITNAVKHFKWEPRGKRRLHKRPDLREIEACGFWLSAEIARIKPRVIVALGASALRALSGRTLSVESVRAAPLNHSSGARLVATYHPSAILRAEPDRARFLREALVADLRAAMSGNLSDYPRETARISDTGQDDREDKAGQPER